MANTTIQLKRSGTAANVPTSLAYGELSLNYADGLLYYKNSTGYIVSFSSGGNSFGTVNANNTLIVAGTPGSIFSLVPGSGIAITGDAINDTITISATGGGGGGGVQSVNGTAGQIYSSGGTTPTLNLVTTGVVAGTYGGTDQTPQIPSITVDAYGRLTAVANTPIIPGYVFDADWGWVSDTPPVGSFDFGTV